MGNREEKAWGWIVIIAIAILLIIALFKILFWISLLVLAVGVIWLIVNAFSGDHEYSWIPALLIVGAIVMGTVSYEIGYRFEKTSVGGQTVQLAKTVVQVEDIRTNVPIQIEQQTVNALQNVTK